MLHKISNSSTNFLLPFNLKYFKLKIFFVFIILSEIALTQVPTITSFTPTTGPVGTTVTITGTNFNTTAANNIVWFGATKATVTTASATS
ncbi:MAG: hypothetical protein EXR24_05330, partial [Ignavibacteria bacterium]|nr:hypothetical protein [Ignavibacteria bacterium]